MTSEQANHTEKTAAAPVMRIQQILQAPAQEIIDRTVTIRGWVRSLRKAKKFSFIVLNDGSCQTSLQVVLDQSTPHYEEVSSSLTGACLSITGKVVASQGKGQHLEMQGLSATVVGPVCEDFPLQKKATSLEFLREQAHLRVRTNTFAAVFRVRHAFSYAIHKFFNDRGFFYIHTPIITSSDCEGAGELFRISILDPEKLPRTSSGKVDHSQDYFGKPTFLTVSGQLTVECFAMGLGQVYTFGPTFRAENSNTPRHLSEFWMIEPEVAFNDLEDNILLATDMLQYLISHALEHCADDLSFLEEHYQKGLRAKLQHVRDSSFQKITYTQAIDILIAAHTSGKTQFEYPVSWGQDLQTEHERYLTETHFQMPTVVTDYPKAIKAFYMKQNSDGKTVRAMDILVPGIGEIIGGSQREDDYERLRARVREMGLPEEEYWWYLQLRQAGSAPHAGFGLGLERMVMYVTGMSNIRDVVPYPRTPKNAEF